jgi:hypothetical protein
MAEAAPPGAPHDWPADGRCANCATALAGNWCFNCGQRAGDFHRSLRHLATEAVEGFTHADGRLWHTLSLLALRPGVLTRDYLRGRRASEIPPLRLFLVTLLAVFLVGSAFGPLHANLGLSGKDAAHAEQAAAGVNLGGPQWLNAWVRSHLIRVVENPAAMLAEMRDWAERFGFLLLPLSALALRVLFPFRRDVKLYDHLIFTMHSLSFAGCVVVVSILLAKLVHLPKPLPALLLLILPVHLFVHMRGVYRSGVVSTLWRMLLLGGCTLGIFVLLMVSLAALSFSIMEG